MKIEIKNILKLFTFLFCFLPVLTWAGSYKISTSTKTVDGNTFCGGGACTSSDTITIAGGDRGPLLLKNFDGRGFYITVRNDSSKRVIISKVSGVYGAIELRDCKYVDLRGDNLEGETYGIKIISSDTTAIRVRQKSGHIKISYTELYGNGIFIKDNSMTTAWTYDTFEIHHNYIHDTEYAGMYLGDEDQASDRPYSANYSIHDNVLNNMGAYGMVLKGVSASSGPCNIYNNTIKTTGLVTPKSDSAKSGISVHTFYGSAYANIYNNHIEDTVGAGIRIGGYGPHKVYNNKVLGCGTGGDGKWASGILLYNSAKGVNIYDNIIIQPTGYGIYASSSTSNCTDSKNLIGDAGLGERYINGDGQLTEGTGSNANIYYKNVASFNFPAWSDDGNYSNDSFSTYEFPWPGKDNALTISNK